MFWRSIAAAAAASAVLALAVVEPAFADGTPSARPAVAKKFSPRLHVNYHYVRGLWPGGPDPYAYSYDRAKYYPYYNSRYWVPRKQMIGRTRYPMRIPEYSSSWGYPLGCKIHSRRNCGVPFKSPAGDPRHYYRRDVQLHDHGAPQHH